MDNLPRFFFYLTGILVISSAFTLFTTELLPYVNNGTTLGTIAFFFFGLVYMNMVVVTSRRFMRRLTGATVAPYVFGIFIFMPPAVWVYIYEGGNATSPALYTGMLLIACGTGAYFGHRLGLKAQITFKQNMEAYLEQERILREEPGNQENNNN